MKRTEGIENVKKCSVKTAIQTLEARDVDTCQVAEVTETSQVMVYDPVMYIPKLQIAAARATMMEREDIASEFEPDWDGTALFSIDEDGLLRYEMMEQDGALLTLHNRYRLETQAMQSLQAIIFDGVESLIKTQFDSEYDDSYAIDDLYDEEELYGRAV